MRQLSYALIALAVIGCSSGEAGEVTLYPLLCDEALHHGKCYGNWLLLKKVDYKISKKLQDVSYWIPGSSDKPKHLEKCSVSDTNDWDCHEPDGTAEKRMQSGKFSVLFGNYSGSDVDKEYEKRTHYVSWLRYSFARFTTWLKPPKEY